MKSPHYLDPSPSSSKRRPAFWFAIGMLLVIFLLMRQNSLPEKLEDSNTQASKGVLPIPATVPVDQSSQQPIAVKKTHSPKPGKLPKPMTLARNADGGYQISLKQSGLREVKLEAGARPSLRQLAEGSQWSIELPDRGEIAAQINFSRMDEGRPALWTVGGAVGNEDGSIYLADDGDVGLLSGCVIFWQRPNAWLFEESEEGELKWSEMPVSQLVCTGPDGMVSSPAAGAANGTGVQPLNIVPPAGGVPSCASRSSGALGTLYLDFNGGSVTNAFWNCGRAITYASPGLNSAQMLSVWRQVSEDFKPFNINVTTKLSDYNAATIGRRMRIVLTSTQWAEIPSGFAAIGSFPGANGYWANRTSVYNYSKFDSNLNNFGIGFNVPKDWKPSSMAFPSDIMCWMFDSKIEFSKVGILAQTQVYGRDITHEFGHTFGMHHAGLSNVPSSDYYAGHGSGNDTWIPVMGMDIGALCQWSKGEYVNSDDSIYSARADSLAIIGSAITGGAGTGRIDDDGKGDTIATAAIINILGSSVGDGGVIFSESDVDYFRIPLVTAGSVQITVTPTLADGNLDAYAELQNSSGTVLASSNDLNARSVAISSTGSLAPGNYYLMVRGSTQGTVTGSGNTLTTTGWTRYGNLGEYAISGTINGAGGAPGINASNPTPEGAVGVSYNFPLNATNSPTAYSLISGSLPTGLNFNAGSISGTPTVAGLFDAVVSVSNSQGSNAKSFSFVIYAATNLPDSLDAPGLTWNTSGSANWQGQQLESFFGSDAARSGAIGANSESVLETLVTGPGLLQFNWRTSSDPGDRLICRLDNTDQFNIGGEVAWEQRGLTIPNGGHYVRWIYKTNAGTTAGLNAGFVDKVVYTPVAQFPSGNQSVSGIIGNYFAWQMTVVGVPATFAVVSGALPPGLALNPTTGEVYGTPTALGTYSPEIAVTNGGGTTSTFPSFSIYPNVSLATALDTSGITWNTGGTYPWYGDTSTNHDGVDAAHSGPLRPNQFSFVEATITGPGTISYYWKASTEANGDIVRFTIDGVLSASLSGEVDWTQRVASMGTGSHTLRWDFYRDSNGNGGQNMVWLDQIVFTPASATLPLITSNTTSSATTGVPYNYQIVSTNSPISYGAIYLPSGLEIDGTTGLISGTPLVSGSFSIIITATNGYGWDFKQLLLTVSPLPFAEGPDAPLYWSTYGNGGNVWFNQSVETQDGVDALRSGPITHNQTSNLQVAVYGPGTFNFWWKTDSEFDYDFLEFRVDGVFRSSISGQRGWAERSVSITGAGTHYLLWTYLKSSSGTVGQDAGWVDFATWTPAPQIPVITSGVLGNGNIGANYYSQITASNTPTSFTKVSGTVPPGLTLVTTGISAGTLSGYPTRPGTYNFQITAANAAGTSSSVSFSIFIKSSFENWLAANGLAGQNALATADPDFDGRNNLLEMALNTSPNTRELNYIPVKVDPVTKRLTATFTRITDFLDIQYEVQISDNLSSWTTIARSIDGGAMQNLGAFSVTDPGGANPTVIVVDNAAPPTKTKRSMRIKITQL